MSTLEILDSAERIASLDSARMLSLLRNLSGQIEQARDLFRELDTGLLMQGGAVRQIVFCGMGGSAISGDLVLDLCGSELACPLIVNRNDDLPFADPRTLVVLSSYSGNTDETLSCYALARSRGARIVALTSGGRLLELSRQHRTPVLVIPGGYPPRCALGFGVSFLLTLLERLHLAPGMGLERWGPWIGVRSAAFGPEVPVRDNPAKQLAGRLHGHILLIYGSEGRLGAVARRWAAQFAENAKQLARHAVIPEMNHNEIAGWRHPADALHRLAAVFLRDRDEPTPVSKRFEWTKEALERRAGHCESLWSDGEDRAERLWSLLLLGDFASVYAAILNGEDPTPIDSIEQLKKHLNETVREGE